jgi:hypothetical protein
LKRGDTFDPEDHRMTHRLGVAHRLLATMGAEPEWTHGGNFTQGPYGKHACCDKCKAAWPEWVTDEVFNKVYAAADAMQTARGNWHQAEINREQAARRVAERVAAGTGYPCGCARGEGDPDYCQECAGHMPVDRPHRFQVGDEFTLEGAEDTYRIEALTWRERDGVLYPTYTTSGEAPYEGGREFCPDVLDTDDLLAGRGDQEVA